MNLVDLDRTGLEAACTAVRDRRRAHAGRTGRPRWSWSGWSRRRSSTRCSAEFLAWSGLGPDVTIEARLAARAG